MNKTPHDPTVECQLVHCYSHMIDEPDGGYIACGECFHVYQTAGELRRAYRRIYWQSTKPSREDDLAEANLTEQEFDREMAAGVPVELCGLFEPAAWKGPSLRQRIWRVVTIRAKDIHFCQHCIHDF